MCTATSGMVKSLFVFIFRDVLWREYGLYKANVERLNLLKIYYIKISALQRVVWGKGLSN